MTHDPVIEMRSSELEAMRIEVQSLRDTVDALSMTAPGLPQAHAPRRPTAHGWLMLVAILALLAGAQALATIRVQPASAPQAELITIPVHVLRDMMRDALTRCARPAQ